MLTVSTETITTFSGSVWVCSTSARSASGVVSLSRQRKTATPGMRTSGGCLDGETVEEVVQRSLLGDAIPSDDHLAAAPVDHHDRQQEPDRQRQPGAVLDLGHVRAEERDLDGQEQHGDRRQLPLRRAPQQSRDGQEQHRVEDERSRSPRRRRCRPACSRAEHERQREHARRTAAS